jgi:hypothetical protein
MHISAHISVKTQVLFLFALILATGMPGRQGQTSGMTTLCYFPEIDQNNGGAPG